MLKNLWNDEAGVIISAELVLVLTIAVLAMVVGLHAVAKAVTYELGDLGAAFGAINQSYTFDGFTNNNHSAWTGSAYLDESDDCDCREIIEVVPRPHVDGSPANAPESGNGAP